MLVDRVLAPFSVAARLRQRARKKAAKLDQSDVMILRYPKSGVTWLRVMITRIYQRRLNLPDSEIIGSTGFHEMAPQVPQVFIAGDIDDADVRSAMAAAIEFKKTILLVRDPRDVAVSMFFHLAKRSTALERSIFAVPKGFESDGIFAFVMNATYGMPRAIAFLNRWWDRASANPNALIIRYEDMRRDPAPVLRQVMALMGAGASPGEIEDSVTFAAFENMKERERSGLFRPEILRPADRHDEDSYKVRKGEVGGFAQYFTEQQLSEVNALLDRTLDQRIGYA
jgi:hypothetical protein